MPHFYAECTENIREEARLPELFTKVNQALADTGIFSAGRYPQPCHLVGYLANGGW